VAATSVFVANLARNVALFFPETLGLPWPAWAHPAIGLVAFACALLPIVWFAQRPARTHRRDTWPVWPPRPHRGVP
jgi:exosortase/archaeosortase family protein